nr:hypothetical protein Itr_chr15CG06110 [Ipomoea trifida]
MDVLLDAWEYSKRQPQSTVHYGRREKVGGGPATVAKMRKATTEEGRGVKEVTMDGRHNGCSLEVGR